MAVWTVKGGRRGEREGRMLESNVIGGGWEKLRSLSGVEDRESLREIYEQDYPGAATNAARNYVGQLFALTNAMEVGELVVLPLKSTGTIAVGRITGEYDYRTDLGGDFRHTRPVEWLIKDVPRDAFDQDLLYSFGAFITFGRVQREDAETRILRAIGREHNALIVQESSDTTTLATPTSDSSPDVYQTAVEQIRQVVSQKFAGHDLTSLVAAILEGLGYSGVNISPPGADRGVDILAGGGALGMDSPRLAVQVKTGQAGVEEFRQLRGTMADFDADQGLLVAWGGFKGTVRLEARTSHYMVRLWDASDLLEKLFATYGEINAEIRGKLPLKQVWAYAEDMD